jgi:hypothetical protein
VKDEDEDEAEEAEEDHEGGENGEDFGGEDVDGQEDDDET